MVRTVSSTWVPPLSPRARSFCKCRRQAGSVVLSRGTIMQIVSVVRKMEGVKRKGKSQRQYFTFYVSVLPYVLRFTFYSPDVGSQVGEFLLDALVAAIQVVNTRYFSHSLCGKTGQHQRDAGTQVCRHDRRTA